MRKGRVTSFASELLVPLVRAFVVVCACVYRRVCVCVYATRVDRCVRCDAI